MTSPNAETGRVIFPCCYCGAEVWHNIKTAWYQGRWLLYHAECWDAAGEEALAPIGRLGTQ